MRELPEREEPNLDQHIQLSLLQGPANKAFQISGNHMFHKRRPMHACGKDLPVLGHCTQRMLGRINNSFRGLELWIGLMGWSSG